MKTHKIKVTYGASDDAWYGYSDYIINHIKSCNVRSVCDIGGGANPLLGIDIINTLKVDYSILDISEEELSKAPAKYKKINADITSSDIVMKPKFDMMFSKMLAEHVKDAKQFHKNVFNLLKPGGIAIHFFPTLYAFPFVINYILPEKMTYKLLNYFSPRDTFQNAKFPAYYSWCRGPTNRQINKFTSIGYEVMEYKGFYGHSSYYNKIPALKKLHNIKTKYLLNTPNPIFTSYAYVVLKKSNN